MWGVKEDFQCTIERERERERESSMWGAEKSLMCQAHKILAHNKELQPHINSHNKFFNIN